jgi:hypothetical protein
MRAYGLATESRPSRLPTPVLRSMVVGSGQPQFEVGGTALSLFQSKDEPEGDEGLAKPGFL